MIWNFDEKWYSNIKILDNIRNDWRLILKLFSIILRMQLYHAYHVYMLKCEIVNLLILLGQLYVILDEVATIILWP